MEKNKQGSEPKELRLTNSHTCHRNNLDLTLLFLHSQWRHGLQAPQRQLGWKYQFLDLLPNIRRQLPAPVHLVHDAEHVQPVIGHFQRDVLRKQLDPPLPPAPRRDAHLPLPDIWANSSKRGTRCRRSPIRVTLDACAVEGPGPDGTTAAAASAAKDETMSTGALGRAGLAFFCATLFLSPCRDVTMKSTIGIATAGTVEHATGCRPVSRAILEASFLVVREHFPGGLAATAAGAGSAARRVLGTTAYGGALRLAGLASASPRRRGRVAAKAALGLVTSSVAAHRIHNTVTGQ